jgi:hypothetical protein
MAFKAVIITYNVTGYMREKKDKENRCLAVEELEKLLNEGWELCHISPLSGTDTGLACALAILEKKDQE